MFDPAIREDLYVFDARAADAACHFFRLHVRHTLGEWAGKPFVLAPWQRKFVRDIFGWRRRADGTRLYRRAYLWVPRRNGKSTLAAAMALLMLLGDGEMGGQVYLIARDLSQASVVYSYAVAMVQQDPDLVRALIPFKSSIYCEALRGVIRPLTGSPKGKHGLSASGIVGDELHEWRTDDLLTFLHGSTANRRQPLEILISTAGTQTGPGWEHWRRCQALLRGEAEDHETYVAAWYARDDDDWTDPAVWARANPGLGDSVKLEYLRAECERARQDPGLENAFRRYHLNQWTSQDVRWLSLAQWDASDPGELAWQDVEARMVGRRCVGGLDLSSTTDLTALVWLFESDGSNGPLTVLPRIWVPSSRIEDRQKRDRGPFEEWARTGAVVATPGDVVDYGLIQAQIQADAAQFRPAALGVDRWNSTGMVVRLRELGLPVQFFGQGFASMTHPVRELERLVLSRRLAHGKHPVLRWAIHNLAIATDPAGNQKPARNKSTDRIDPAVALLMALGMLHTEEEPSSVYEKRGIIQI